MGIFRRSGGDQTPPCPAADEAPPAGRTEQTGAPAPTEVVSIEPVVQATEAESPELGVIGAEVVETDEQLAADQPAERRALIDLIVYAYDRARSPGVVERLTEGLAAVGVTVQQPDGEPYDPQRHEVGGVQPTDDPARHDTVAETELVGFTDRGTVIREPIVVVFRHE